MTCCLPPLPYLPSHDSLLNYVWLALLTPLTNLSALCDFIFKHCEVKDTKSDLDRQMYLRELSQRSASKLPSWFTQRIQRQSSHKIKRANPPNSITEVQHYDSMSCQAPSLWLNISITWCLPNSRFILHHVAYILWNTKPTSELKKQPGQPCSFSKDLPLPCMHPFACHILTPFPARWSQSSRAASCPKADSSKPGHVHLHLLQTYF